MIDKAHLLNSKQMAEFVARGFLRFDELVPNEINNRVMRDIDNDAIIGSPAGTSLSQCYRGTAIREMLDLPQIQGLIQSLVGADPLFDHDAIHVREPNEGKAQGLHADSIIDLRRHFDIQIMYFPHDVPLEMGGTLLLPGSHFRKVNEADIAAYQNMRGQIPMECKAGSILALHHGIWHCGRQNQTDRRRYMFKLRLNPAVRQLRLWNTDDLDEGYREHQEIFRSARTRQCQDILSQREPWFEEASGRLEIVNRLWRFLTGDALVQLADRLENLPA